MSKNKKTITNDNNIIDNNIVVRFDNIPEVYTRIDGPNLEAIEDYAQKHNLIIVETFSYIEDGKKLYCVNCEKFKAPL